MVGLNAPKSKEENKKKSKKAPPLLGSFPCPTSLIKFKKKKKKPKRGVEDPPPPPLLAMVGNKTFPQNYTHKHKKQKRGSRNSPFYLAMVSPRT
jgi:hypothetical protein